MPRPPQAAVGARTAPYNAPAFSLFPSFHLPMHVHAPVFKAYDIRGIVDQTIDATFALHLGRAFGS